jgi:hypothetical protein
MPDQYRREYDDEGRRSGWRESERSGGRGNDRPRAGGDWRGGHSGRWSPGEPDERAYAMSDRGGIRRETGFDRGTSRDERYSRDWQQRVSEDEQGYRAQDRQCDREWQGEPDWQSDRPRGWHSGPDWSQRSAGREQEPWHPSHEHWRGSHEDRGDWDESQQRSRSADRGRRYERGESSDWSHDSAGGRYRQHERHRFGTGGGHDGEQAWPDRGERPDPRWARGGERESYAGSNEGFGGESARGIGSTLEGAWPDYSGRGPKGYKRSDNRIREDVSDRLLEDHDVDASDITVEVKDGDVTLTGTVATREQKRRAEELVERTTGVSEVANNLRVNREWERAPQPATQAGPSGTTDHRAVGGAQHATQANPAVRQQGAPQSTKP